MTAELMFIGTELLMGQVLNTNSQYISRRLQALGISCYYQTTLGDNMERLVQMYRTALNRADVVITTGGLGPTVDDITKQAAAKALEKELVLNSQAAEMIKAYFNSLGRKATTNNDQQGYFTHDSRLLINHHGTAPGAQVPAGEGKFIFHLPGPPHEMIPMFEENLVPFFEKNSQRVFKSKYIRIVGMGESEVDFKLKTLEQGNNPSLSPYASPGEVVLRATARGHSMAQAEALLAPLVARVTQELGKYIYRIDDDDQGSLEDTVINLALLKGQTLSVAESLTGGMIGAALAGVPGASKSFMGGMIVYTNHMKQQLLSVPAQVLNQHGAVSPQCAKAMAQGALKNTGSDFALAVTGVAGPGPDDRGNPQGLVYIAAGTKEKLKVETFHFSGSRQQIRKRTTLQGLNLLRIALLHDE